MQSMYVSSFLNKVRSTTLFDNLKKILTNEPGDPQPLHYGVSFNFLIEIAKLAFDTTETGAYPIIDTTTYQPDYSGDLRTQHVKDTDNSKTKTDPPFAWPPLCPTTSLPLPAKRILQPNPIAQPSTSTLHPWEYCNKCWAFGDHSSNSCNAPHEASQLCLTTHKQHTR